MREAKKWIKEVRGAVEAREESWEEKDRMIFWKRRMYIPDSIVLREEILWQHHDQELTGHQDSQINHKELLVAQVDGWC